MRAATKKLCAAIAYFTAALLISPFESFATQVEDGDRFDLICDMQEVTSFHPGVVTHFSRHLSIDLTKGKWCSSAEDCKTIRKVARVTDDQIFLIDQDTSFMRLRLSLDRHSWRWLGHAHIKQMIDSGGETTGSCKKEPFTSFPPDAKLEKEYPQFH